MNSVKIDGAATKPKRDTYHHGDLRRQLVAAAEQIIAERGVDGFTLREAARRLGVSPAAPAHHFADARGLLTEVALLGFRDLSEALEAADQRGVGDPARRLFEQGLAYVRFALAYPARFQLMFRYDKHDRTNAEFVHVSGHAYRLLEDAIRAATGTEPGQDLTPDGHGLLLAVWSMVHGFSHLALGGELENHTLRRAGAAMAGNESVEALLRLTLQHLLLPSRAGTDVSRRPGSKRDDEQ